MSNEEVKPHLESHEKSVRLYPCMRKVFDYAHNVYTIISKIVFILYLKVITLVIHEFHKSQLKSEKGYQVQIEGSRGKDFV